MTPPSDAISIHQLGNPYLSWASPGHDKSCSLMYRYCAAILQFSEQYAPNGGPKLCYPVGSYITYPGYNLSFLYRNLLDLLDLLKLLYNCRFQNEIAFVHSRIYCSLNAIN